MDANDLLCEVESRGLHLAVVDGTLKVRGPRERITPDLLSLLSAHKVALIERLRNREFLWRTGHRSTQTPDDPRHQMEDFAPTGAWWWRWEGETDWRTVPGRGGEECSPLPEWLASLEAAT